MRTQKEPIAERHLLLPQIGPYSSRRVEQRYTFTLPVIVLGLDGGGHVFWEVTPTLNVSWHGCLLHLNTRPRGHMLLALQLVPRDGIPAKGAHHALYEIAWTRDTTAGCDVGARVVGEDNLLALAFGNQKPRGYPL